MNRFLFLLLAAWCAGCAGFIAGSLAVAGAVAAAFMGLAFLLKMRGE